MRVARFHEFVPLKFHFAVETCFTLENLSIAQKVYTYRSGLMGMVKGDKWTYYVIKKMM